MPDVRTTATALISWVPEVKGGRHTLPTGPIYSTLCRFESDTTWPEKAWSLVAKLQKSYGHGQFWLATIQFLAPTVPGHLLKSGERFSLFEGRRLVATGIVRGESSRKPSKARELAAILLS